MQSLLVDVNRIRNLATKNSFVAHEACRRSWKSLTLLCSEDAIWEAGFTEGFKFDFTPPRNAVLRRTPSIEDSEYSSSAATVVARVVDEEDDANSPTMASVHLATAPGPSAPPNSNVDPAPSSTSDGNEYMLYVFKPFWSLLTKGGEAYELIVFKRVHMGGCYIFAKWLQLSFLIHLVLWVVTLKPDGRLLRFLLLCDAMINSA